jgi:hypothetical protein
MRRPRRPWRWTGTWRNCGKDSVFQQPLQRSSNHLTRKKTLDYLEPDVNPQRSGFFTGGRHTREDDTERNARFSFFRRMAAAREIPFHSLAAHQNRQSRKVSVGASSVLRHGPQAPATIGAGAAHQGVCVWAVRISSAMTGAATAWSRGTDRKLVEKLVQVVAAFQIIHQISKNPCADEDGSPARTSG